jgi:hypothetical protein
VFTLCQGNEECVLANHSTVLILWQFLTRLLAFHHFSPLHIGYAEIPA